MTRGAPAFAGIDLGGTKTSVAVSGPGGRLDALIRTPTVRASAREMLSRLCELAAAAAGRRKLAGIGLGIPGVIDEAGERVRWIPNLPGWRGVPVAAILRRRFKCPVRLENDADMAALGEAARGAGRGIADFVTLTVGTGIGGGIVSGGRLLRGAGRTAGAAGWLRVGAGRLEDVAAGPGIERRYRRLARGPRRTCREICRSAARGERAAGRAVTEAAQALGSACASLVTLLDPRVLILGGGVMEGAAGLMLPVIRCRILREAQPSAARNVRVVRSSIGGRAGALGALAAALEVARR